MIELPSTILDEDVTWWWRATTMRVQVQKKKPRRWKRRATTGMTWEDLSAPRPAIFPTKMCWTILTLESILRIQPIANTRAKKFIEQAVVENRTPLFYARREQVPNLVKTEVILNWVYLNKSRREEAARRDMTEQQVDNIIYEFQVLRRIKKKTRKSENMRRLKVTKIHIEALWEFARNHFNCGFTLAEARHYFRQKYFDLRDLSLSTIHRVMHKELKLSFKMLGNTDPKKISPENKSNLSYWWKTIIWFLEGGFYLIFVDEFIINRNKINTYGWARKGMPGRLLKKPTDFKMSFVVGHSEMGVEGIIGTKTTFNQAKYMKFLKELALKEKKRDKELIKEKS